jgi:hypothetical protein
MTTVDRTIVIIHVGWLMILYKSGERGSTSGGRGGGAEIFPNHYGMPWALAYGHLEGSWGMLPLEI